VLESEPVAQPRNVVVILGARWVTGMPSKRPLRRFASDEMTADHAVSCEGGSGERLTGPNPAVVQLIGREGFIEVQVDTSTSAVMDHEVPGAIASPRIEAIDSDAHEDLDRVLKRAG
jgi:hypothetical protein